MLMELGTVFIINPVQQAVKFLTSNGEISKVQIKEPRIGIYTLYKTRRRSL